MGSLIKRPLLTLSIAVAMLLGTSGAIAATTKPTPKPSVKTTVKATPKATPRVTAKATAKPKVTAKATAKPKVTAKATAKPKVTAKTTVKPKPKPTPKKTVVKRRTVYTRKAVGVAPSPSPTWPPKYFDKGGGGIYAKVPTSKELLSVMSASPALAKKFVACSTYACGVVQVASYSGCTWWDITSTLSGPVSKTDSTLFTYGSLRTTATASNAKQIVTILMISPELLKKDGIVRDINVRKIYVTCNHTPPPPTETIPKNIYLPNTPTPTPTPTESPTDSPTPSPTSTN